MERKIGEIFTYNGKTYQVVQSNSCKGCAFNNISCNCYKPAIGSCLISKRTDKTSVIFKEIKDMDNIIWKIVMFCLAISVLGLTISYTSQKEEIEELQTTVTRQANAIQQLEKEKNNTEVTIPQYLDSLPNDD